MKCMFCHTDNHSIDECSKVDYCESGEHYVEIENIWDNFSECYNCTSTEEYAFFNNIPVEYAEKIKDKKMKLQEVHKLLNIINKFPQKYINMYRICENNCC